MLLDSMLNVQVEHSNRLLILWMKPMLQLMKLKVYHFVSFHAVQKWTETLIKGYNQHLQMYYWFYTLCAI